ncbi:MAG: trigger factor [Kiritimatiellae bacterium]|nr:trigger factor [Kiritimatiellia bacterium]
MKTDTKKLDKCQVKLVVTLDAEEAAACIKEVEKAFVKEARLPGFRPGKAPVELIRKQFAAQIKDEVQRTMFRRHYADAVKAEGVDEVALADVQDVKCDATGGGFTAIIDVKPVFKLPAYKGLKIAPANAKVEDSAVAEQIERLRAAYAKYEDAKEGETVAAGDFVQIDYTGTVDGKPILELAPDAKIVASGTGFWTQVEEGRFLPEILEAVKGMKAGETKAEVKATFDKASAPEPLKGKKAVYSVTLKAFRRRVLPTDAEFAEKAKAESVEALTKTIRESMEKQAVEQEAARRENDAVEMLLKKVDFDVPQSQVHRAMDGYLNQLAQRAQYAGLTAEYFEQNREKILKDAEENATRQVRLWYVIDAIAEAEKIEAKDEERGKKVVEFILANAK